MDQLSPSPPCLQRKEAAEEEQPLVVSSSIMMANSSTATFPSEWSNMNSDLFWMILKPLKLADNIRVGGVCSSWYSAASCNPHPPACQSPFLIMASSIHEHDFIFLDIAEVKEYSLHLPELCGRCHIVGSCNGQLIYLDSRRDICIFNPITRSQVRLPSRLAYIPSDLAVTVYGPAHQGVVANNNVYKAIISPDNSIVVVIYHLSRLLAFSRPGDDDDDALWNPIDKVPFIGFRDIVFYKGLLCALTLSGFVVSFDLGSNDPKFEVICEREGLQYDEITTEWSYLVEINGNLFLVWRNITWFLRDIDAMEDVAHTWAFRVFRMDVSSKKWEEVESIGDYALFLGHNHSFALSTSEFPELMGDSIYFTDDFKDYFSWTRRGGKCSGVCNLRDGSIGYVNVEVNMEDTKPNWRPLVWFTPMGPPPRNWKRNLLAESG